MSDRDKTPKGQPRLGWDSGSAYDFFFSLEVLHNPDQYGLRASWAAGVRSRLPTQERKLLEEIQPYLGVPLNWIYRLPEPKDATSAIWALRQTPPAERMVNLAGYCDMEDLAVIYKQVAERRSWDNNDVKVIHEILNQHKKEKRYVSRFLKDLPKCLDWWSRPDEFGELYLSALQTFFQVFFAEEEKRIAPYLKEALDHAQMQAERLDIPDLMVELSQGVHFDESFDVSELILIPVFWSTPIVSWSKLTPDTMLFLFGARPEDASLIPGEVIPESMLRALKALADPTRLQILRYLSEGNLTPAQLSRRLRLRAPTVIHHLKTLRLAGLVHLTVDREGESSYAARLEAISGTLSHVGDFLGSEMQSEMELIEV